LPTRAIPTWLDRKASRRKLIDMDGVQKVLELRSVYGEPKKALTDPTKYYDSKYYDAAHRD
jgi:hypothetical protein